MKSKFRKLTLVLLSCSLLNLGACGEVFLLFHPKARKAVEALERASGSSAHLERKDGDSSDSGNRSDALGGEAVVALTSNEQYSVLPVPSDAAIDAARALDEVYRGAELVVHDEKSSELWFRTLNLLITSAWAAKLNVSPTDLSERLGFSVTARQWLQRAQTFELKSWNKESGTTGYELEASSSSGRIHFFANRDWVGSCELLDRALRGQSEATLKLKSAKKLVAHPFEGKGCSKAQLSEMRNYNFYSLANSYPDFVFLVKGSGLDTQAWVLGNHASQLDEDLRKFLDLK